VEILLSSSSILVVEAKKEKWVIGGKGKKGGDQLPAATAKMAAAKLDFGESTEIHKSRRRMGWEGIDAIHKILPFPRPPP
jgi:hypothetical protein